MTDDIDAAQSHDLLLLLERNSEEQFVVVAAIQGCSYLVGMQFLGHPGGLLRDGDAFEIEPDAAFRCLADLEHVGGEAVRKVDHRGRRDAGLGERFDYVEPCVGMQLSLQEVFVAFEFWLRIGDAGQGAFFAFEQVQPHVCGPEVARYADQIVEFGAVAVDNLVAVGHPDGRYTDRESGHRGGGVAAGEVDSILLAGRLNALVEVVERLDRDFARHADRNGNLRRTGIHRQNVAASHHDGLVTEVLEREVCQVEIDSFEQQVGREQHCAFVVDGDHCGVVARALECRVVVGGELFGEVVYESEFAESSYFGRFCRGHDIQDLGRAG